MRGVWWWLDRWRASKSKARFTAEQKGCARELWDALWDTPERIVPDDDRMIGIGIVGDPEAWARQRDTVLSSWRSVRRGDRAAPWAEPASEDGWTHDVALEVIGKALELSETRSAAGRRGAESRWQGRGKQDGKRIANGVAKTCPPSPSPSLSPVSVSEAGAPAPGPPRRVAARARRSTTAAERERLGRDPELMAVATAYASAFGGDPGVGVLRAARRAREGGYSPETCHLAIEAVRLASQTPESFPPGGKARWCAEHNHSADYVLRPGVIDKLASEHPGGDVEPLSGIQKWLDSREGS